MTISVCITKIIREYSFDLNTGVDIEYWFCGLFAGALLCMYCNQSRAIRHIKLALEVVQG